jgi:hypothetical protein
MGCGDWKSKKKYRRLANPMMPARAAGKNEANHEDERRTKPSKNDLLYL